MKNKLKRLERFTLLDEILRNKGYKRNATSRVILKNVQNFLEN